MFKNRPDIFKIRPDLPFPYDHREAFFFAILVFVISASFGVTVRMLFGF